jgi:hypothetical protein
MDNQPVLCTILCCALCTCVLHTACCVLCNVYCEYLSLVPLQGLNHAKALPASPHCCRSTAASRRSVSKSVALAATAHAHWWNLLRIWWPLCWAGTPSSNGRSTSACVPTRCSPPWSQAPTSRWQLPCQTAGGCGSGIWLIPASAPMHIFGG